MDTFLKAGQSCVQAVQQALAHVDHNQHLNVFIEVFADEAMARARELDQKVAIDPSSAGRLFGAIVSIKDVIAYRGHELTAASKMLEGYHSLFSATAVERILAEDAIIIGRTNCDEFAMGSDNRTSIYGATKNAIDEERVPGGSSGGAAVSVQIDACHVALASDTGGSVRQPASFCGVIGFKPSYGRISRHGLIAYGSSFDQIGLIGTDHEQIWEVYNVMQGQDGHDSTLVARQDFPHSESKDRPLRIGYLQAALEHSALQKEVKEGIQRVQSALQDKGHELVPLELEHFDYVIPAYYVLTSAEASSNLSRYDGVRYGHRASNAKSLDDLYTLSRTSGFGDEVKRRILLGTFVLSYGYYDAFYAKAQKVRRLIKESLETMFEQVDLIILPTAPGVAWPLDHEMTPVEVYLADIYSVLANLAGIPAISMPVGEDSAGMPYGIQCLGASFEEKQLIEMCGKLFAERQTKVT